MPKQDFLYVFFATAIHFCSRMLLNHRTTDKLDLLEKVWRNPNYCPILLPDKDTKTFKYQHRQ